MSKRSNISIHDAAYIFTRLKEANESDMRLKGLLQESLVKLRDYRGKPHNLIRRIQAAIKAAADAPNAAP